MNGSNIEDVVVSLRGMTQRLVFDDEWPREVLSELMPMLSNDLREWLLDLDEEHKERVYLVLASCASAAMLLRTVTPGQELSLKQWVSAVLSASDLEECTQDDPRLRALAIQGLLFALAVDTEELPAIGMPLYCVVHDALKIWHNGADMRI